MRVVAVLLAAGGGSRFAAPTHKLLADLRGAPVYRHSLDAAVAAAVGPVIVVTGAAALELPAGITVVHNSAWASGQASSLALAVTTTNARFPDAEAVVVGLADQPFVPADAWQRVARAPADCAVVVATYAGVRGPNPVRLHRSTWPMLPTTGDAGARALIRENPQLVCEVPCGGSAADIDTLEDLKRWTSS
jgi:CTP:molybdopterin cytidylyltransferase MocA